MDNQDMKLCCKLMNLDYDKVSNITIRWGSVVINLRDGDERVSNDPNFVQALWEIVYPDKPMTEDSFVGMGH